MHGILVSKKREIGQICSRWNVRRLSVFGSASSTGAHFDPVRSDVDFVVEFQTLNERDYADYYFGLKEALEQALNVPVDLVEPQAVMNPVFQQELDKTCELVYAA